MKTTSHPKRLHSARKMQRRVKDLFWDAKKLERDVRLSHERVALARMNLLRWGL